VTIYPGTTVFPEASLFIEAEPNPIVLHSKTLKLLEDLPPYYFRDPPTRNILNAFVGEIERIEAAMLTIEKDRFPQTATDVYGGLSNWERLLNLPVAPGYLNVAQRQQRAVARWRARNGGEGKDWVAAVSEAIGTGSWEYYENYPGPYQLTVFVPYGVGSTQFNAVSAAIRPLTPAHLELIIDNKKYFIVDVSKVDEDTI
jgi:hypothetical protein